MTENVTENLNGLAALQLEDVSDELREALIRGSGVEEPGGGVGSRIAMARDERRMTGLGEQPGSVSYRGVVALMEHFGASRQALITNSTSLG